MKKTAALIALFILPVLSFCQTTDKTANDAFVLTRMINKFHVEPRPINGVFSRDVYNGMLKATDPKGSILIPLTSTNSAPTPQP